MGTEFSIEHRFPATAEQVVELIWDTGFQTRMYQDLNYADWQETVEPRSDAGDQNWRIQTRPWADARGARIDSARAAQASSGRRETIARLRGVLAMRIGSPPCEKSEAGPGAPPVRAFG